MGTARKWAIAGLLVTAVSVSMGTAAKAEEVDYSNRMIGVFPIPDRIEAAYFSNDRDFFTNRSIPRQVSYLLGPGILIRNSFPEAEITRDGQAVHELYRDLLAKQLYTSPRLRTPDLPTPFNQSILTLPAAAPAPPLSIQPPVVEPPTVTPSPKPSVPALW